MIDHQEAVRRAEALLMRFKYCIERWDLLESIGRDIAAAIEQAVRETAEECAAVMCLDCKRGDVPQWRAALYGRIHVWKAGNGHTRCSAAQIWDKLLTPETHASQTEQDTGDRLSGSSDPSGSSDVEGAPV